jgi:hypothetical protein
VRDFRAECMLYVVMSEKNWPVVMLLCMPAILIDICQIFGVMMSVRM